MDLLTDITWTFTETEYISKQDFNSAISQYQMKISKESATWKPTEILLNHPHVDLVFMAWIEENELAENEIILEDEDFFDDQSKSEFGLFHCDIQARLTAENGKNFSALELMYQIDLQMKSKELGDDVSFEGLGSLESEGEIPKFYLFCGS